MAGNHADLFRRDWSQSLLYASTLTAATEVRAAPEPTVEVVARGKVGDRVEVVDERRDSSGQLAWVEVALGLGATGFMRMRGTMKVYGVPELIINRPNQIEILSR